MDFDNTKIVESDNNEVNRLIKEGMYVRKNFNDNLNSKNEAENVSVKYINIINQLLD